MSFSNATGHLKKITDLETNCYAVFGNYPNGVNEQVMNFLFYGFFENLLKKQNQLNLARLNKEILFYFDVIDYICTDNGYGMTIKSTDQQKNVYELLSNYKYSIIPYITYFNFRNVREPQKLNYFIIDINK